MIYSCFCLLGVIATSNVRADRHTQFISGLCVHRPNSSGIVISIKMSPYERYLHNMGGDGLLCNAWVEMIEDYFFGICNFWHTFKTNKKKSLIQSFKHYVPLHNNFILILFIYFAKAPCIHHNTTPSSTSNNIIVLCMHCSNIQEIQ